MRCFKSFNYNDLKLVSIWRKIAKSDFLTNARIDDYSLWGTNLQYTKEEVIDFIESEGVRFIRLAFCDVYGNQKNIAIVPEQLQRAFEEGMPFDGSSICGFTDECNSDLFLFPIPSTLTILPWRSTSGKVVRMFCDIKHSDGTPFVKSSRYILEKAVAKAKEMGVSVDIGVECCFYLFQTDEKGLPTQIPFDNAGYLDVAPADKGENIRREITLTLKKMDIHPKSSHHDQGPGQNGIDFKHSTAILAADNTMNFINVVNAIASNNGLYADFSPKPLEKQNGNNFHITIAAKQSGNLPCQEYFMAGVMKHIKEITAFLNPTPASYQRLKSIYPFFYISWGHENRSTLIRIPSANPSVERFEIRSPDPSTNPYIAFALLIYAGLDGIKNKIKLPESIEINLHKASTEITEKLETLPESLEEAIEIAKQSSFINEVLPKPWIELLEN